MSEIRIEKWEIAKLKPYEMNVKLHDETQVAKIASSIDNFGWDQPIVVDGKGVIIKGHGRFLAAQKLKLKHVPVYVRKDLSAKEVRASRLADNEVAKSDIDTMMFRDEIADLDFDLSTFFDPKDLEYSEADLGDMNDDVFIDDIDKEVKDLERETEIKSAEALEGTVSVAKAFGFNNFPSSTQRIITHAIAWIEHKTQKQGYEAFISHFESLLSDNK